LEKNTTYSRNGGLMAIYHGRIRKKVILNKHKFAVFPRKGNRKIIFQSHHGFYTPVSNMSMENGPFEDVFPIKHGDIPLLC